MVLDALHRLPDLVIIGAQRSGTSSLFDWLAQHPAGRRSSVKEVHYFDDHPDEPTRWYRHHFPIRRSGFAFETTPSLLYEPDAPARFAKVLTRATAVVLLRDPAARAISHYHHTAVKLGQEHRPLEEAIWAEPTSRLDAYRARGYYADQLERWADTIGWDRLHVLISEEMYADPHGQVDTLMDRLGQPRYVFEADARNVIGYERVTVPGLAEHFAPHNAHLAALLGRDLPW